MIVVDTKELKDGGLLLTVEMSNSEKELFASIGLLKVLEDTAKKAKLDEKIEEVLDD